MTTNKHFNSYKEGLDLEFLREYCMEHGKRRVIERGEMLEETGELSRMIGLFNLQPRTICCPIRITVTEQRKDSEILDAGEREHEEMIGTQLSIIR